VNSTIRRLKCNHLQPAKILPTFRKNLPTLFWESSTLKLMQKILLKICQITSRLHGVTPYKLFIFI